MRFFTRLAGVVGWGGYSTIMIGLTMLAVANRDGGVYPSEIMNDPRWDKPD